MTIFLIPLIVVAGAFGYPPKRDLSLHGLRETPKRHRGGLSEIAPMVSPHVLVASDAMAVDVNGLLH